MKLEAGKLLISTPELLLDHIFNQSVILLTDHNENGSVGFIINKPLILNLNDVIKDVPGGFQLWNGGPVDTVNLFYLHTIPNLLPDSMIFDSKNKTYIGGDFNKVKQLLNEGVINNHHIKFFLGYSGWGKNQLEKEIKEKAWFVSDNNLDIFTLNPKNIWKEKIVEIDPENIIWKNAPLNPHLN